MPTTAAPVSRPARIDTPAVEPALVTTSKAARDRVQGRLRGIGEHRRALSNRCLRQRSQYPESFDFSDDVDQRPSHEVAEPLQPELARIWRRENLRRKVRSLPCAPV